MLKKHKWKLLLSSLVILLPMLAGGVFWNQLPETMPTHWGIGGTVDGWSSRAFSVFAIPAMMLGVHWLCIGFTALDRKNKNQHDKVVGIVLWMCPILSVFVSLITWSASLGHELEIGSITFLMLGLVFALIGNYLPKCRQNHTIGIKIKWTLENEENWNATHRFGGKVWFIGGLLIMACAFLPSAFALIAQLIAMFLLALLPIIYSGLYHQKQVKEGIVSSESAPKTKASKIAAAISCVLALALVLGLGVIMFTGDIEYACTENALTIEASFWNDLSIDYQAIEHIEYREHDDAGSRTSGFGSARLLAGTFRNDEFGSYTRYSYTDCDAGVVLNVDGKILVISRQDAESTKALYEQILSHMQ